jgi:hypothetical protein
LLGIVSEALILAAGSIAWRSSHAENLTWLLVRFREGWALRLGVAQQHDGVQ